MSAEQVRASFLAAVGEPARAAFVAWPGLTDALSDALRTGRDAWSTVELDPISFAAHLGARIRTDVPADQAFASARIGDLYLACACVEGDARALRELETLLTRITPALGRLRLEVDRVDEVLQMLRRRLLLPGKRGRAKLLEYAGRGELERWLRVVAMRDAMSLKLADRKQPTPLSDDLLEAIPSATSDAELLFLQEEYGEHLRRAFGQAVADLPEDDRRLLRFHLVEGLTVDQIAAMLDIHRATAARQVERARDRLGTATRKHLQRHLGLDPFELASLMRIVDSQIDLSVRRLLEP